MRVTPVVVVYHEAAHDDPTLKKHLCTTLGFASKEMRHIFAFWWDIRGQADFMRCAEEAFREEECETKEITETNTTQATSGKATGGSPSPQRPTGPRLNISDGGSGEALSYLVAPRGRI